MENSKTQKDSLENIADINEMTDLTPADDDILDQDMKNNNYD